MDNLSVRPTAGKYGLILGLASIAYSMILWTTGMFTNQALGWVSYLISIAVIVLALREYRSLNGGFMSFGQGVGLGVLVALIGGVISSIWSYVYLSFIDPGMVDTIRDMAMQQLYDNPQMTEEAIEMAEPWIERTTSPLFLLLMGIFGSVIGGLIIALIASAIMRKDRPVENMA